MKTIKEATANVKRWLAGLLLGKLVDGVFSELSGIRAVVCLKLYFSLKSVKSSLRY